MNAKIEIYGLKINREIAPNTDLSALIVSEAERQVGGVRDGDIIVVTSKIVSKAMEESINLQKLSLPAKPCASLNSTRLLQKLWNYTLKLARL